MRIYIRYTFYIIVVVIFSVARAGAYEEYFQAVGRGDDRGVARWLAQGIDPNTRDPKGQTALHLALRDQAPRVAEVLWKSNSLDVNASNADGETPLMLAALRGDIGWTQRLLDRGAKVHQEGWSPIHYAATGPQVRVVALLLDHGAPVDATSPNRSTPLMMAARYGTEESVELLLARGANPKRRNDLQLDAVEFARQSGRDFLVERLQRAITR
jgi:ankyrin repeat protein